MSVVSLKILALNPIRATLSRFEQMGGVVWACERKERWSKGRMVKILKTHEENDIFEVGLIWLMEINDGILGF